LGGSEAEEHGRGSNLMLGALSPSGSGGTFLTSKCHFSTKLLYFVSTE